MVILCYMSFCSAHLLQISYLPPSGAIAERETEEQARRKAEKEKFWICVCYDLPLLFLARDLSHGPAAMVIRTGGTARSPPPCYPNPLIAVRDLSGGSLWWPLFWRLWVSKLILDGDGDHFLFSPIFSRTPVSRDNDCYSLAKTSEILAVPIFCRRQYLWRFLHGGPVQ